jgi:hypothetical protein
MNKPRADFTWRIVRPPGLDDACILVVDKDQGRMSVTNDAEAVCAHVRANATEQHRAARIFYRDSEGRWDELLDDRPEVRFRVAPLDVDFRKAWAYAETAYPTQEETFT